MSSRAVAIKRVKPARDARHLMRYLKSKVMTPEDIAKEENVNLRRVKDSIRMMESYEKINSEGQLQLAVRDLLISTIPQAKETIGGLLRATNVVLRPNKKTGKEELVREEDKTTRLEGARLVKDLITAMQPKAPAMALQVNQNNNAPAQIGSAETVEERMRRLRAAHKEHNLLPAEVAAVPQYIDQGRDDDDGEDIGDEGDDEEE